MPVYAYEALSESGDLLADQLDAASVSAAIAELESRGLAIRSIRLVAEPAAAPVPPELPIFHRRLEAALARREALVAALSAFAEEMGSRDAARVLLELIDELRGGATAEDLVRHENAAAWLPLILRSPASTTGGEGFEQLIFQATRRSTGRKLRRRMLLYPITVLVLALVLCLLILYAVVPTFSEMFREFGLRLAWGTHLVIWLSDRLHESPILSLTVLFASVAVAYVVVRTWIRYALTTRLFGSFIAGNSLSVAAMAGFTETLGELLSLEAPLPDALQIAGRASRHRYYRELAEELAQDARQGSHRLQDSVVAQAFPANVLYALSAGGDGGPSVPLLRELSSLYNDRISQRFDWSMGIIGPLTLVVVGVFVAFLILALLLPLVSMISSLA